MDTCVIYELPTSTGKWVFGGLLSYGRPPSQEYCDENTVELLEALDLDLDMEFSMMNDDTVYYFKPTDLNPITEEILKTFNIGGYVTKHEYNHFTTLELLAKYINNRLLLQTNSSILYQFECSVNIARDLGEILNIPLNARFMIACEQDENRKTLAHYKRHNML